VFLGYFKRPDLPPTPTGKTQKLVLRQRAKAFGDAA
jgi:hypothetical protein